MVIVHWRELQQLLAVLSDVGWVGVGTLATLASPALELQTQTKLLLCFIRATKWILGIWDR